MYEIFLFSVLSSLDPLILKKWELKSGENSPVNIQLTVRNGEMVGLRNFSITKLRYTFFFFFSK